MIVIDIIIYILIGTFTSWIFYYWKKKELIGGFIGGLIVGLIGSIILGGFLLVQFIELVIDFLQKGGYISNVNIISSLIGGYIFLYFYNKISHDRQRKDY